MERAGQINAYHCPLCGGRTVTINGVDGVTPFMMDCRVVRPVKCRGTARSMLYRVPPGLVPKWEWYRPEGADLERLEKKATGWKEHVSKGGLALRRLTPGRHKQLESK